MITVSHPFAVVNIDQRKRRARQNVILELGYFIGRLGRPMVIPLIKDEVEQPSDYHGIVYVPFRDQWPTELARELSATGLNVDVAGLVR